MDPRPIIPNLVVLDKELIFAREVTLSITNNITESVKDFVTDFVTDFLSDKKVLFGIKWKS